MANVFEYRGVEGLVFAEVTGDDNLTDGGYKTGTVEALAPVAEIGKTVETSSEAHYYDNTPLVTIQGEGPDEITIRCAGLTLEKLAKITGRSFDPDTGMLVEGPRETRYFAIGYKTKDSDGKYRYVWRLKGTFAIPADTNVTEDDGTEANGTELTFTGIYTTHIFNKGKRAADQWEPGPAKGLVVSDREGKADLSKFFETVTTPDTLKAKGAA